MIKVSRSVVLPAPAAAVWKTIRDFNGAPKYLAAVTDSTIEGAGAGSVRTLTLQNGGQIVERLEALDDEARTLRYAALSSPLPVDKYVATMSVEERGKSQCEVTWSSTFHPKGASQADAKDVVEGMYEIGFDGLRQLHEG